MTVSDRGQLFVADQILENEVVLVEGVVVQASLRSHQVGDGLGMLASNDGVIQLEVVQGLRRVLEVELDHFDGVREGVQRHFGTLGNRDEVILFLLEAVARVEGEWLQMALERILTREVLGPKTSDLVVKELGSVENGLLFLARHLLEQIGVFRVLDQVNTAVGVLVLPHVSEHEPLLLLGTDPGGQGVAHHEDWEVLLYFEVFILHVGHGNDEGIFVDTVGNGKLGVARQVQSVDLVEKSDQFVTR